MKLKEKIQWVLTIGGFVFGIMGTLRWQGPAGRDGINGKDGINGINGINGIDGKDGRDGVNGIDGINGVDGLNGLNGIDGKNGKDGIDGKDGKDGIDGKDGKDGSTPYIGENGNWFIDGVDLGVCAVGKDGKDGVDGKDGKDGVLYESPTETIMYPTSWIDGWHPAYAGATSVSYNQVKSRYVSNQVIEIQYTKTFNSTYKGDIFISRYIDTRLVYSGDICSVNDFPSLSFNTTTKTLTPGTGDYVYKGTITFQGVEYSFDYCGFDINAYLGIA